MCQMNESCCTYEQITPHIRRVHRTSAEEGMRDASVVWALHLQHVARTALQHTHTATHCNTRQHTATHGSSLAGEISNSCVGLRSQKHCNTRQHTTIQCNTLQKTATHCNVLQRTATHCNALQRTATYCNTLQFRQENR